MVSIDNQNCLKKLFINFLLIKCAISFNNELEEGNKCSLHDNTLAHCKKITDCKWLRKGMDAGKLTFDDIRQCGFEGKIQIVCCGDELPTLTEKGGNRNSTKLPIGVAIARAEAACTKYNEMSNGILISNIVGGREAQHGEFPHMAAIGYKSLEGYDFRCGGTLISESWILTAAHCISTRDQPELIRLGKLRLFDSSDGLTAVDREVAEYIIHPDYDRGKKKHDIALIRMSTPATMNGNDVRPACLRTQVEDVPLGQELFLAGWGSVEPGNPSNKSEILLKTNVTSMSLAKCNETIVAEGINKVQPVLKLGVSMGQVCTNDPEGKNDACSGDSGGPLQLYDYLTGLSTVVGVLSFSQTCASTLPNISTRVAFYLDWIAFHVWP